MTKSFLEEPGDSRAAKLRSAGWKEICSSRQLERKLTRIAYEIVDRNDGASRVAIVGIRTRGELLAERLAKKIGEIEQTEIPLGVVEISLYRDDVVGADDKPEVKGTNFPFNIDAYDIILVDDVLYTGRTIRAALDAIADFGRPRSVQLAVLCDRGHRELPVQADYIGLEVRTLKYENIRVCMVERDGEDAIFWGQINKKSK